MEEVLALQSYSTGAAAVAIDCNSQTSCVSVPSCVSNPSCISEASGTQTQYPAVCGA